MKFLDRYKHIVTSRLGGPEHYAMNQRMTIMDKPVQHMTWRELKDTVANILLEWPAFLDRLRENLRPMQNLKQVLLERITHNPSEKLSGCLSLTGPPPGESVCRSVWQACIHGCRRETPGRRERNAAVSDP